MQGATQIRKGGRGRQISGSQSVDEMESNRSTTSVPCYKRTNENAIGHFGPDVLSVYYLLKSRFANGIAYPNREQAAAKLGINRSTLSRWLSMMIAKGLATKKESRHVVLATTEQVIRMGNGGTMPIHKCTLEIQEGTTRKEIEEQLLNKLLEEKHRQVLYAIRETEINHAAQEKYGIIHDATIRRDRRNEVKSRYEERIPKVGAPMSAKSISSRLGISERKWFRLSKKWKEKGWIDSFQQREQLNIWMSIWDYLRAKPHFGFATYRDKKGFIHRVHPNILHMERSYDRSRSSSKERGQALRPSMEGGSGRFSLVYVEKNGKKVPIPVLDEVLLGASVCG